MEMINNVEEMRGLSRMLINSVRACRHSGETLRTCGHSRSGTNAANRSDNHSDVDSVTDFCEMWGLECPFTSRNCRLSPRPASAVISPRGRDSLLRERESSRSFDASERSRAFGRRLSAW